MSDNNIVYISGSPRRHSNTDILLKMALSLTGGEFIKLSEFDINPCNSCWGCQKTGFCTIKDDMTETLLPKILTSDGLVIGSPVYFNNVSSSTKAFIDRTWCIRGKLRNKIGGAIVVGRMVGAEGAITAINAFFTKHEMLIANRGVSGKAFEAEQIIEDGEAFNAVKNLANRIVELQSIINTPPA